MNLKLSEIVKFLEDLAPPALQESYDNCGLLIGELDTDISRALITLDVTEAVIDEAIQNGSNLIIAHHPLIFSGIKKINGKNYVERCILKAIRHHIAIYAIHTNLDNVQHGVNRMIVDKLGLRDVKILQPKKQTLTKLVTYVPTAHTLKVQEAVWATGAGQIGNYSECSFVSSGIGTFNGNEHTTAFVGEKFVRHQEPESKLEFILPQYLMAKALSALKQAHPYEEVAYDFIPLLNSNEEIGAGMVGNLSTPLNNQEWLQFLKERMELTCIRHTTFTKNEVVRVAVCGGSGSFLLNDAIAENADVLVTADFKYHDFFNAEDRLMICDIGHFESEKFTSSLLVNQLLKKYPTFAAQISSINTNPINYYF